MTAEATATTSTNPAGMNNEIWAAASVLEKAMYYRSLGWKPFSLYGLSHDGSCSCGGCGATKNAGKHPNLDKWPDLSVNATEADIETWFPTGVERNIGINCKPSGLFVIDIDPRSGGHTSFEVLERLLDYSIPDTVEALTGAYEVRGPDGRIELLRGRHLYFIYDQGQALVGNLNKQNLPGIDIKHNGYVGAPGSMHVSGVSYEWAPGKAPWEIDIASAPEELLEGLRKKGGYTSSSRAVASLGGEEWQAEWDAMRDAIITPTPYAKVTLENLAKEIENLTDGRNVALNSAAFVMGTCIGGGQISFATARDALALAAEKSYGREYPMKAASVESVLRTYGGGFENGAMNPRYPYEITPQLQEIADRIVSQGELLAAEEFLTDLQRNGLLSKGGALNTETVTRVIQAMGPICVGRDNQLWYYSPTGVWLPGGEDEVTRRLKTLLGNQAKLIHIQTLHKFMLSEPPEIDGVGPSEYINFQNGMLNWETLERVDHDPKYMSVFQLPFAWDPAATCPTYDEWIESVVDSTVIPLLDEVMGVCLHVEVGPSKAPILYGTGRNGKGTFVHLVDEMIPSSMRSHIPIQDFGAKQFATANLFGKVMNSCGDLSPNAMTDTAMFKQLTGGDTVKGEHKHKKEFYFKNTATMLFSANELPSSPDTTYGYYSRLLIIPFDKVSLKDDEIDATLEPRLKAELQGIAVRAVLGLKRTQGGKSYSAPKVCDLALDEYKRLNNSVQAFFDSRVVVDPKANTPRMEFFQSYRQFCADAEIKPLGTKVFYKNFEEVTAKIATPKRVGGDTRSFEGIRVALAAELV